MLSFPNAKINLGLNVIERRSDGFHNIESIMLPIAFCDSLEIILNGDKADTKCDMEVLGLPVSGTVSDNLCYKAFELVNGHMELPPVKIKLLKNIPMGAGLGGGSSDAAFTIKMLNELCGLALSDDTMKSMCAELGSDCSFFIDNQPALATGKGEILKPINLRLANYVVLIVHPNIHINTGDAYNSIMPDVDKAGRLEATVHSPIGDWKDSIQNDFETSAFGLHPELSTIKNELYNQGAIYASMTGSGSAVYGIFKDNCDVSPGYEGHRVEKSKFLI